MLSCGEGLSLSIGRDSHCDLVVDRPWISRSHALITNADSKVRFIDRSSSGTFLAIGGEPEVFLHREEIILVGRGQISPGLSMGQEGALLIEFEVVGRSRSG